MQMHTLIMNMNIKTCVQSLFRTSLKIKHHPLHLHHHHHHHVSHRWFWASPAGGKCGGCAAGHVPPLRHILHQRRLLRDGAHVSL